MTMALAIFVIIGLAVALGLGCAAGWYTARGNGRYADPQLHPGHWELVGLIGHTVQWRRKPPQTDTGSLSVAVSPHVHQPAFCMIGDGLAHEDRCDCGARRFGVFGPWEHFRLTDALNG